MKKQNARNYTVKKTLAWLLAVCITLASFTGVDAYAAGDGGSGEGETYSELRVKEYLSYDDNGKLIMDGDLPGDKDEDGNIVPICDVAETGVSLPGERLWIDLITYQRVAEGEDKVVSRQHIHADSLTVRNFGQTHPLDGNAGEGTVENGAIKDNVENGDLIDFIPEKEAWYQVSYEDSSIILGVHYPDGAFYKEPELSEENLLHNGYGDGTFSYYRGINENSVYFYLRDIGDQDSDYRTNVTLAGCSDEDGERATCVLRFWDDAEQKDCEKYGGDSGIEGYFSIAEVSGKHGWYKLTFAENLKNSRDENINSFYLSIHANVAETWKQEDGNTETGSYSIGFGLDGQCYSSGLYGAPYSPDGLHDFSEERGDYGFSPAVHAVCLKNVSINGDGVTETPLTDSSKIKIYLWEEDEDGNGKWSEEPVSDEYAECRDCSQYTDCLEFEFHKEGRYGVTDGSGSFYTMHVWLPVFGFYTEPRRPDGGEKVESLLVDYHHLEGQAGRFYMMTWFDDSNPDCPDMETVTIKAYDGNGKDVSGYIDYSKEIRDDETDALLGYEVKVLEEASCSFQVVVSGKTVSSYFTDDGDGNRTEHEVMPYEIQNQEWWVTYCPLSGITITTPPLKTVYTEGEKFDPAGMVVTAAYEYGQKKEISSGAYELSKVGALSTGDSEITVSYRGKTAKVHLTVNAKGASGSSGSSSSSGSSGSSGSPGSLVSPSPAVSPSPGMASPSPAASPSPVPASPSPAASSSPDPAASSNPPVPTSTPDATVPDTAATPDATATPDMTAAPDATAEPGTTDKPDVAIKVGDSARDTKTGVYKITKIASNGTPVIAYTPNKAAKKAKSVTIKSTVKINGKNYKVTKIADNALAGNKKLKKVTIPASITVIGKNAFKNCKKLKSIVIPSNVTKVGNSAFKGCSSLKKVTVKGSKIKSMEKNAFKNLAKDVAIKIPKAKKSVYKRMLTKAGYTGTIKFR